MMATEMFITSIASNLEASLRLLLDISSGTHTSFIDLSYHLKANVIFIYVCLSVWLEHLGVQISLVNILITW